MKSGRFGFLKHYRKIRIEGTNLTGLVNKCIKNDIELRCLNWKNHIESDVEIKGEDFDRLRKLAGHSNKISVLKEGGAVPLFGSIRANILTIAGAFLIGALIFYQSLFVAEIRIDGYRSIDEASIRQTLADAGLYEGVRKKEDYGDAKAALYDAYDKITWVSIFEKGRLIKVTVAEAENLDDKVEIRTDPVNIVAERSGMIEKVIPLRGNASVQKGDYVNKGDVLISGRYKYQSSDYSKGDDFFYLYSHAEGQAYAKVPEHITYYFEKNVRKLNSTGRFIPGIYARIGDIEIDTAEFMNRYEVSERKEITLAEAARLLPFEIRLVKVDETSIEEEHISLARIRKTVDAAVRQYAKDNLEKGEEILNRSVDYSESEGLIKADVMLELLKDIGVEKKIKKVEQTEKSKEKQAE